MLSASTEIGQGTNTIFSQIAADALGIDCDDIEVAQPDTSVVPNSGPTVASRTCMVVGKLVESAALALKHSLIDAGFLTAAYTRAEFHAACSRYVAAYGPLRRTSQLPASAGIEMGRRSLSRRCLWHLRLGGLRCRGIGRHDHLGDPRG